MALRALRIAAEHAHAQGRLHLPARLATAHTWLGKNLRESAHASARKIQRAWAHTLRLQVALQRARDFLQRGVTTGFWQSRDTFTYGNMPFTVIVDVRTIRHPGGVRQANMLINILPDDGGETDDMFELHVFSDRRPAVFEETEEIDEIPSTSPAVLAFMRFVLLPQLKRSFADFGLTEASFRTLWERRMDAETRARVARAAVTRRR